MISIETFLIGLVILIGLYILGLYATYKENVLGFVASGFAALTTIALSVLAGFGRVGNVSNVVLYNYNYTQISASLANGIGSSTVNTVTTLIDPSLVYITGFIALMMVIVLIFIIGRYIATIALMKNADSEEE